MMVTLRLYRQHDLDLITLYRHPSFSLPNAIKTALCAYVRNEQFFIKQPEPFALGNEKISKIVQIHIQLSDNEKDVIEWIKNIKEGYRNSVLKNIIRAYLLGPCVYSYVIETESGINQSIKTSNIFKSNVIQTVEIKGRGYKKPQVQRTDNRRVEDSQIAKDILSGNKPESSGKVFVERIADDKVDVKALENITAVEPKPVAPKKVEPVKEEPAKSEVVNEAESLDDMLDDIDAMMGDI